MKNKTNLMIIRAIKRRTDMKVKELIEGKKVISSVANPIVGNIISYSTVCGKDEKFAKNNFVKIKKLDGGITFITADLLKPFVNYCY